MCGQTDEPEPVYRADGDGATATRVTVRLRLNDAEANAAAKAHTLLVRAAVAPYTRTKEKQKRGPFAPSLEALPDGRHELSFVLDELTPATQARQRGRQYA